MLKHTNVSGHQRVRTWTYIRWLHTVLLKSLLVLLPSTHLSCSVLMSNLNTFINHLAHALILMCWIILLIFPERQIMSTLYLRGFTASASSFLTTQPYQWKSRRPWKKENKVLLTVRWEFHQSIQLLSGAEISLLQCKSEVSVKFWFVDNLCAEEETVSPMNPLIGCLIGCN